MYWDNNRIADVYATRAARAQADFEELQNAYINNELLVIYAVCTFDDRAYDADDEFLPAVCTALYEVECAVEKANKTVDKDMELDSDFYLSYIEDYTDGTFAMVVGMTTDKGADILEKAFADLEPFGAVKFTVK